MPSAPQRPRKYTDESFVITIVTVGLSCVVLFGFMLNSYLDARKAREVEHAKTQAYKQYLRNTPVQAPAPMPPAVAARLEARDQLLAHPAVKPGPGFSAPGVQSTGKVIVDAIDRAQGRPSASGS